jgi:hypothetical protein
MRQKALRKRLLFNVLNRTERVILYLVPKCVEKVRSRKLIDILAKLIMKLSNALENPIVQHMNLVGKFMANKVSLIAQRWGHKKANEWAHDRTFMKYLTIVDINNIAGFSSKDWIEI